MLIILKCSAVIFRDKSVFHDWCNKGCGMCCPVCGMVHIKEPLLLIGKSSSCGCSGFPLSLSEWSFTICPTPYNRKIKCVFSASLNKTFPSFSEMRSLTSMSSWRRRSYSCHHMVVLYRNSTNFQCTVLHLIELVVALTAKIKLKFEFWNNLKEKNLTVNSIWNKCKMHVWSSDLKRNQSCNTMFKCIYLMDAY